MHYSYTLQMLEYWMAINDTETNESVFELDEVLEDPGSAALFDGYPPWLLYFAAGCCLLFMLIGIPGNLITVAALFRTKKVKLLAKSLSQPLCSSTLIIYLLFMKSCLSS